MSKPSTISARWQLALGCVLVLVPTVVATIFFTNNGTGNLTFRHVMETIMGSFMYVVMLMLIVGMVLILRAAGKILYRGEPMPSLMDPKNRLAWLMNLINAVLFSFFAITEWNSGFHLSPLWTVIYLGVGIILGTLVQRRMYPSNAWTTSMIGDPSLDPKDEREKKILSEAGQMALAISFLVTGVAITVLVVAPKPSLLSTLFLFIALASFQRGFYGLMAWKNGLR